MFNPLNPELNTICHLLALLRAHHILHVSRIRVKQSVSVKCTLVRALRHSTGRTAHRGSRGIALLFVDHCTRRVWGVRLTPRSLFNPGKIRYPLYRRLGGPQVLSGHVRKISPHRDSIPGPSSPVASRYTDWATRPTVLNKNHGKVFFR